LVRRIELPVRSLSEGRRFVTIALFELGAPVVTTVQIELPDSLAREAAQAGLLTAEVMERLLREAMRQRAVERLRLAMDRMAQADIPPMTEEEIQAEIDAVRAERRARCS
jgi:DTW domain-containing protein YfiP